MSTSDETRCAVVIGNSDGIGLALTRRLLDDGWSVTGLSRRSNDVEDERYVHRTIDVTAAEFRDALADAVDALPRLDLVVYAAGIGEKLDLADLGPQTATFEVNLLGAARTVEVVIPRMLKARAGHIIGLSSLADVLISADAPAYGASKAALSSYFLGLRAAVRRHGVQVTTVRFGFVDTKLAKAKAKPMMISVAEAVDVLVRCVQTRPTLISYPRRMAAVTSGLRVLTRALSRLR